MEMEQQKEDTGQQDTDILAELLRLAEMDNICDEIDDVVLNKIGRDVVKFGKLDDDSREGWKKRSKDAMDLALQVVEEKNTPWPGASNVKYPLMTVAALQFHARAYPAVITANKVVKGQVTGKDDGGKKQKQADRIANHMNYQLLEENEEWEGDVDSMLLALPIEGCEFKKTYYSAAAGYNMSDWIRPLDLIVNEKAKSLETCPRITHRLWFYPHEIDAKIIDGIWKDENLQISQDEIDEEVLQEFWEQHTFLDLFKDGHKKPWIVTVHKKSEKVVRMVSGYDQKEIVVSIMGKEATIDEHVAAMQQAKVNPADYLPTAELVRVPRLKMFTKFTFFPNPEGGFYDLGFGQLIGPLADTIDTTINQLIDSGTLSNRTGGFIADGVNVDNQRGNVGFTLGEFKRVKLPSTKNMQDAIFQLKFNEPSLVLFQLLGMLVQATKDITSIQDVMTGSSAGTKEPLGTSVMKVEQGMKVFSAIYKRIYRSLKQEFKKLFKLNGRHLQMENYFRVLDTNEPQVVTLQDYRDDGTNVQPVSDPQLASNLMAMAKAGEMLKTIGFPNVNVDEILRRFYESLEVPNPESLIIPPDKRQQGPDPKLQLELLKAADQHVKIQAEIVKLYAEAIQKIADAESKEIGAQIQGYAAGLKVIIDGWQNDQGRSSIMAQGLQGGDRPSQSMQGQLPGGMQGLSGPGVPGPGENGGAVGLP